MRNLKKILALALALVMTFSLMATANAFSDSDTIAEGYQTAATVLEKLEVYKGQKATDGTITFNPKGDITRAEVAAILYRVVTGDTEDDLVGIHADYNKFSDVPSTSWYAPYVNYCANAGLIKGVGGDKFNPNGKINGYSALALILRAIGYGQNKEFEGSGWDTRTASTAQRLGMLQNVNQGTLGANASRELVAEIIFRGMIVPQVTYTPLLGYSQYTLVGGITGTTLNPTLGYEIFGLAKNAEEDVDKWGRPSEVWTWKKGDITVNTYSPVKTYTTAVDECDIYADAGLNKDNCSISRCYIDGLLYTDNDKITRDGLIKGNDQVTSDGGTVIGQYDTMSVVGAQGRVTEVYKINNTVWLVEINTYLGRVTKVNDEAPDKNGHQRARTVNVDAWAATLDIKSEQGHFDEHNYAVDEVRDVYTVKGTVETADYNEGDYVLVNILRSSAVWYNDKDKIVEKWDDVDYVSAKMEITAAATRGVGGFITDWTDEGVSPKDGAFPATTTINGKEATYNDSDKFFVGWRDPGDQARVAYLDTYGNIIGFVTPDENWLVIEKAEWKHSASSIGGGWALADVMLADGTQVKDVTIASVAYNGQTNDAVNTGDRIPGAANGQFSDDYTNNGVYYCHLFSYYVGSDGKYHLEDHADAKDGKDIWNTNDTKNGMDIVHSINYGDKDNGKQGSVYNGVATIYTGAGAGVDKNYVVANDSTVFLVWNPQTYTYTVYKGIDKVPTYEKADLCILRNTRTGYVEAVVINGTSANIVVAYVPDTTGFTNDGTDSLRVYPVGGNRSTTLKNVTLNVVGAGIYEFTVSGNTVSGLKVVDNVTLESATLFSSYSGMFTIGNHYAKDGMFYDRTVVSESWVTGDQTANSFKTIGVGGFTRDFRVTDETKVIIVGNNGQLTMGRLVDITEKSQVIVGYSATLASVLTNNVYRTVAQYVYILEKPARTVVNVNFDYVVCDDTTGVALTFKLKDGKGNPVNVATVDSAKVTIYNCNNDRTNPAQLWTSATVDVTTSDTSSDWFTLDTKVLPVLGDYYYVVVEDIEGTDVNGNTFELDEYETKGVLQATHTRS